MIETTNPFKWRHFQAKMILLCVRWYLRYPLRYRDLEEIMLERGLHVDHTMIYRWVQYDAPEKAFNQLQEEGILIWSLGWEEDDL